jgi:hypothetical protein
VTKVHCESSSDLSLANDDYRRGLCGVSFLLSRTIGDRKKKAPVSRRGALVVGNKEDPSKKLRKIGENRMLSEFVLDLFVLISPLNRP